ASPVSTRSLLTSHRRRIQLRPRPQPLRRARVLSAHYFVELLLQSAGYRTSLAVADDAEINFAQRHDFRRRTAHKHFVGNIKLIARDGLFHHGVARIPSQRDHGVASDALENPCPRRGIDDFISHVVPNVVPNDEEIFAGALGHVSIGPQHDGLIEAGAMGLGLGQNRAHIISRDLGLGHHDVRMQPRERCNIGANAVFLRLGPQKRLPLPHRNHDRVLTRFSAALRKTRRATAWASTWDRPRSRPSSSTQRPTAFSGTTISVTTRANPKSSWNSWIAWKPKSVLLRATAACSSPAPAVMRSAL